MTSAQEELAKVQLEPELPPVDSDEDLHMSDMESVLTDKEEDPDEEYAVDAIKYAYWLKRKGKPAQWYYGILWGGYLKTESEMDIPSSGMNEEDNLKDDQVYQFWTSFNPADVPTARLRPGKREPPEPVSKALKYPYTFDCPTWRMKEWLKETEPRRLLSTFLARRQYIKNNCDRPHGFPVPKPYSDYYVHKREQKKKKKEQNQAIQDVPGPTAGGDSSKPVSSKAGSRAPSPSKSPPKENGKKSGMEMINELVDPPSDDLSGLSDLDTVSDEAPNRKEKRKASKHTPPLPEKKKRKQEPIWSREPPEPAKKAEKAHKAVTPTLPPPSNRLTTMGKIKKKRNEEPLFMTAPSPASTIDEPAPQFGEPMSGIFGPASPVMKRLPPPDVQVIAPTPRPVAKASDKIGDSHGSPGASSQLAESSASFETKPDLSLLARTRVILEKQSRDAQAKKLLEEEQVSDQLLAETSRRTSTSELSTRQPSPPPAPIGPPPPTPPAQMPVTATTTGVIGRPPTPPRPPSPTAEKKPEIINRPKYQQPVKMRFIDTVGPIRKNLPSGPSGTSSQLAKIGDPSTQHGKSSVDPQSARSALDARKTSFSATGPTNSGLAAPSTKHGMAAQDAQYSGALPQMPQHLRQTRSPPAPAPYGPRQGVSKDQPQSDQKMSFGRDKPPPTAPKRMVNGSYSTQSLQHPTHLSSPSGYNAKPSIALPVPIDPRLSKAKVVPAPLPTAASNYDAGADPRRRALASMPSPVSHGGISPVYPGTFSSPRSPDSGSRRLSSGPVPPAVETICEFRADIQLLPNADTQFRLGLFKGSTLAGAERLQITRTFLSSPNSTLIRMPMEEVDDVCLTGVLSLGGQVLEWTKVAHVQEAPELHSAGRGEYETLKDRISKSRKAYVGYTEYNGDQGVTCHYAIVLASPDAFDFVQIGMGAWSKETIKVGLFVLALPLTSVPTPRLPNPVRPSAELLPAPTPPSFPLNVPALQSYGIDHAFLSTLSGQRVMKYPGEDGPTDQLHATLVSSLKQHNAIPASEVDTLLVMNHRFMRSLKSSSIKANITRRTAFYAFGPSLQLYPSQWNLTRIWQKGGLVTFSPTFILRNPDTFNDIMEMIRSVDTWAAYVIPGVVEWCKDSWDKPQRCPDPAKAFEALSRSLFFDQHILPIAGELALSGGGLAVSCTPPVIHNAAGCRRWMDWLRRVTDVGTFEKLAEECKGVSSKTFASVSEQEKPRSGDSELDLIDIERSQIEDLAGMRAKPHLLPYRRYIYIGGTAIGDDVKAGAKEIEFVAAENFAAVLSGVSRKLGLFS